MAATEYKLSMLKTLIGDRSDDQGTLLLFELLDEIDACPAPMQSVQFQPRPQDHPEHKALVAAVELLDREFKRFKLQITGTVHAEIQQSFSSNFFDPGCSFQTNLAQPTIQFLRGWSSTPTTPGDKSTNALSQIGTRLQLLEQDVMKIFQFTSGGGPPAPTGPHSIAGPTTASPFGWGMAGDLAMTLVPTIKASHHSLPHAVGWTSSLEVDVREKIKGCKMLSRS